MNISDKIFIDINLVQRLIAEQFPQWIDLEIKPVELSGWDNRTFHLGSCMTVRLPSHARYAEQVKKEQKWLPQLAAHVPLMIPVPVAMGQPSLAYPLHWSVYQWIDGNHASVHRIADICAFGGSLAHFLNALRQCPIIGGPLAGEHNFYRGGSLDVYDDETRQAIRGLVDKNQAKAATEIWDLALSSCWKLPPVWVHGDIAPTNLLVQEGVLRAVIDFGQLGMGDPACDLAIAWTFLTDESRKVFRASLQLDDNTWARGRGWALWKALCWAFPGEKRVDHRVVHAILKEYGFSIVS